MSKKEAVALGLVKADATEEKEVEIEAMDEVISTKKKRERLKKAA